MISSMTVGCGVSVIGLQKYFILPSLRLVDRMYTGKAEQRKDFDVKSAIKLWWGWTVTAIWWAYSQLDLVLPGEVESSVCEEGTYTVYCLIE